MAVKQFNKRLSCCDSDQTKGKVHCSVRNNWIAIHSNDVEWPHFTMKEANDLIMWLEGAVAELMVRENPKVFDE